MEKVIEIKNLSKAYERYVIDGNNSSKKVRKLEYVLKDINLDIYKSDVVGIIGPNGSGKSTLLKILSGITAPTEGEVLIIGKVASILELGVGFDMELSGYDNIFYGGRLLGFSNREIRQSIDKIIEFSGLEDYIYTPVKFYSSGMVMRLAYSLVTNVNADVLLLDEITAVGDIEFSQKVISEIFNKIKKKLTVLIVSHDLNFLSLICNKIISIEGGALKYYGNVVSGIMEYKRPHYIKSYEDFENRFVEDLGSGSLGYIDFLSIENDFFNLISLNIPSKTNRFDINDEISMIISLDKKTASDLLDIGIVIYSLIDKLPVLTTSNKFSNICVDKEYVGKLSFKITIPKHFFNIGTYQIDILIVINVSEMFRYPDVFKFIVEIPDDKFSHYKKFITSLIPITKWEIEKL